MLQHFQQVLLNNHTSLRDSLYFFRPGDAHSPTKKRPQHEWTFFPLGMFNIPHCFGMLQQMDADDANR